MREETGYYSAVKRIRQSRFPEPSGSAPRPALPQGRLLPGPLLPPQPPQRFLRSAFARTRFALPLPLPPPPPPNRLALQHLLPLLPQ